MLQFDPDGHPKDSALVQLQFPFVLVNLPLLRVAGGRQHLEIIDTFGRPGTCVSPHVQNTDSLQALPGKNGSSPAPAHRKAAPRVARSKPNRAVGSLWVKECLQGIIATAGILTILCKLPRACARRVGSTRPPSGPVILKAKLLGKQDFDFAANGHHHQYCQHQKQKPSHQITPLVDFVDGDIGTVHHVNTGRSPNFRPRTQ